MPKKKATKRKTTKTNKLANVNLTIEHTVPTTQYGNVRYHVSGPLSEAKEAADMLANVIGDYYPPYNPHIPGTEDYKPLEPDEVAEEFNQKVEQVYNEENNIDEVTPAF